MLCNCEENVFGFSKILFKNVNFTQMESITYQNSTRHPSKVMI